MKQLKLAVVALFAFATFGTANAQDSNNPWAISIGVNDIDIKAGSSTINDYLGHGDANISNFISRVSVGRYLDKGFSLEGSFSLNTIENFSGKGDVDFNYYSFDINGKYDLNEAFGNTGWFDPFAVLGLGYAYFDADDKVSGLMLNIGVGFNAWFNDNVGLTYQTVTKEEISDVNAHFQHSLGVVFRFGGKDKDAE